MQFTCEWQQQQFNHKSNTTLFSVSRKSVFKWLKKKNTLFLSLFVDVFCFRFFFSFSLVVVIVVVGFFLNHFFVRSFVQSFVRLSIWWHLKFVVGLCILVQFQFCMYVCCELLSLSLTQIPPFTRYTFSNEKVLHFFSLSLSVYLSLYIYLSLLIARCSSVTISFYLHLHLSFSVLISFFLSRFFLSTYIHEPMLNVLCVLRFPWYTRSSNIVFQHT